MIATLLLTLSSYWIELDEKQALVCDIEHIHACVSQFPNDLSLPLTQHRYRELMGHRHAMVLPVEHQKVAGVILTSPTNTPTESFAIVNGISLTLPLKQQASLSLWHEQGHLENTELAKKHKLELSTNYHHEWLADLYLLWRSVQETQKTDLAWQQYHRRNLAIIDDPNNLSHWSSPYLFQVLIQYSAIQIQGFDSYSAFLDEVYPKLKPLSAKSENEMHRLVRYLFNRKSLSSLPNYLSWQRPQLGLWLAPTFTEVLGEERAQQMLKQLNL